MCIYVTINLYNQVICIIPEIFRNTSIANVSYNIYTERSVLFTATHTMVQNRKM